MEKDEEDEEKKQRGGRGRESEGKRRVNSLLFVVMSIFFFFFGLASVEMEDCEEQLPIHIHTLCLPLSLYISRFIPSGFLSVRLLSTL